MYRPGDTELKKHTRQMNYLHKKYPKEFDLKNKLTKEQFENIEKWRKQKAKNN